MSDTLHIRRAEISEAPALTDLALRSKAMWGYDDAFMAMCVPELTVQPAWIEAGDTWVAVDGDRLAGMLTVVLHGDALEVHMIFVEPDMARSGVGRFLWDHAEVRARAHRAKRLELDADPNAVPFYERMGMRIVGESPSGSIPGRTLPRMAKSLAESPERAA
jgi:GNAT superfamily N-acetyltransferase